MNITEQRAGIRKEALIRRLRKDKERLEWLMAYIVAKGGRGVASMPWTVVDPSEVMEDRMEITFDRAAIDAERVIFAADLRFRRTSTMPRTPVTILANTPRVTGLETWLPARNSTMHLCKRRSGAFVTVEDYRKVEDMLAEAERELSAWAATHSSQSTADKCKKIRALLRKRGCIDVDGNPLVP